MFCPTCGNALSQQLKYCNRCGAHLATTDEIAIVKAAEKRFDNYLDGIFWITILGLGLILGGMALMKKLQVSEGFMIGYMILSSAAFVVNFALSLREVQRMRKSRELSGANQLEQRSTNEHSPLTSLEEVAALPSVTENTTRSLETAAREKVPVKKVRDTFE